MISTAYDRGHTSSARHSHEVSLRFDPLLWVSSDGRETFSELEPDSKDLGLRPLFIAPAGTAVASARRLVGREMDMWRPRQGRLGGGG